MFATDALCVMNYQSKKDHFWFNLFFIISKKLPNYCFDINSTVSSFVTSVFSVESFSLFDLIFSYTTLCWEGRVLVEPLLSLLFDLVEDDLGLGCFPKKLLRNLSLEGL